MLDHGVSSGVAVVGLAARLPAGHDLRSAWRGLEQWRQAARGTPAARLDAAAALVAMAAELPASLPRPLLLLVATSEDLGPLNPLHAASVRIQARNEDTLRVVSDAMDLLQEERVDAIVVGGLDSAGGALMALQPEEDARRLGLPVLAVLRRIGTGGSGASAGPRAGGDVDLRSVGLMLLQGPPGIPVSWWNPGVPRDGLPWCALEHAARSPGRGMADLLTAVLALHERTLPPGDVEDVRPLLGEHSPFLVHAKEQPWIHGLASPRRALLGQTGADGNSLWLLAEASCPPGGGDSPPLTAPWPSELVALDGDDLAHLREKIVHLGIRLDSPQASEPCFLADLAATSAHGCAGRRHRIAFVARSVSELKGRLDTALRKLGPGAGPTVRVRDALFYGDAEQAGHAPTAWLFPGQGAQYAGMGAETARYFPSVRTWFDLYEEHQHRLGALPVASIVTPPSAGLDAACKEWTTRNLHGMEGGAQAGFLLSLALDELLGRLRIPCDVVVGNSNGENAALIACGRLALDRGALFRLMARLKSRSTDEDVASGIPLGTALAVSLTERAVLDELLGEAGGNGPGCLFLALDNCPHQVVLFGDEEGIARAEERLRTVGALCLRLPFFERAYHTPLFEKCALDMRDLYDDFAILPGRVPVYSCATAGPFPDDPDAVRDLAALLWARPVLFRQTVERLYREGVRSFLEVGPGGKLVGFVRDTLRERRDVTVQASNVENRSELLGLQAVGAHFFSLGHDVDLRVFFEGRPVRLLEGGESPAPVTSEDASARDDAPPGTRVPAPDPLPPFDLRTRLVQEHFGLMREFLDHQARMCLSLFGESPATLAPRAAPRPPAPATTPADPASSPPAPLRDHFQGQRTLDVSRDLFLLDHTLGRRPPQRRDLPCPLPVMPFTFSMELLAEAAQQLCGGSTVVTAVRDVRGRRWLALDTGHLDLAVTAHLLPDSSPMGKGEARVQIEEIQAHGQGPRFLAFEGTVCFGERYPEAPPPLRVDLDGHSTPKWSVQEFYKTCLFHGPSLQALHHLRGVGPDCIEADVRVPPTHGLFRDVPAPALEIPAPTLDAALQLMGYWLVEQGREFFGVFPFYIGSYQQFTASPPPGTALVCRGRLSREHDVARGDFDFIDGSSGRVVARMEDVRSRYFAYPPSYLYTLYWPGPETFLARPWVENGSRLLCWRIDFLSRDFLDDGWGIWKRALAHVILGESERQEWYRLPPVGPSRTRWLLERAAAKDAARSWLHEQGRPVPAPGEIRVSEMPDGSHCFRLPSGNAPLPALALASRDDRAVACVVPPGMSLGIDVGGVDSPSPADDGFDEPEEALLSALGARGRLAATCARRAARRAVGAGIVRLASLSPTLERAQVRGEGWGDVTLAVDLDHTDDETFAICLVPASVAEVLRPGKKEVDVP